MHFSYVRIHVDYRSQPTKEFDTIGGDVGPDSDAEGYPQVTPHQSYLLTLVYGIDAQAQSETKTVLIVNDAFPIDAQGMVTLTPGSVEQGTVYPAKTAPLSQIVQQLAKCTLG
jgi:hypothetical protein